MKNGFAIVVVAVLCALFAGTASAGTLLKSKTCRLKGNASCSLFYEIKPRTPAFDCYARFSAVGRGPFPFHSTMIEGIGGFYYGSSTSRYAYSEMNVCGPLEGGPAELTGSQETGSSRTFVYRLQLFSGRR